MSDFATVGQRVQLDKLQAAGSKQPRGLRLIPTLQSLINNIKLLDKGCKLGWNEASRPILIVPLSLSPVIFAQRTYIST
jgi:hypothetical protein